MKKTYLASVGCLRSDLSGDYYSLKEFKSKREAVAWLKNYAEKDNKKDYCNASILDYCILIKDDCDSECVYSINFKKINSNFWEKIGG